MKESDSESCWLEGTTTVCERSMILFSLVGAFVVVVVEGDSEDLSVLFCNFEGDSVMLVSSVVFCVGVGAEVEEVVVGLRLRDGVEGGLCTVVDLYLLAGGDGSVFLVLVGGVFLVG